MGVDATSAPSAAEVEAALAAVRRAARMCVRAQGALARGDTLAKGDDSPVTVADFAAQAVVSATLAEELGVVVLVGEEDTADLAAGGTLLDGVVRLTIDAIGPREPRVDAAAVLDWIALGGSDGSAPRYWTLDPIDGTKGFLRGDQYAIALALIAGGEVVLGVLGCPNLANADGTRGAIFLADDGGTRAWYGAGADPVAVHVAAPRRVADARMCESVESAHSDHGDAAAIASRLGILAEPLRIDSQCKYAVVGRGDASIYLRLPTRADYREKVWDHAAGKLVVERAGGTVTDIDGAPLDFTRGRRLERNRGIVATSGPFHDEVLDAVRSVVG